MRDRERCGGGDAGEREMQERGRCGGGDAGEREMWGEMQERE